MWSGLLRECGEAASEGGVAHLIQKDGEKRSGRFIRVRSELGIDTEIKVETTAEYIPA